MSDAPLHYRRTIRRLVRFAVIGIAAGLILGVAWTEVRKGLRYGDTAAAVAVGDKEAVQLPPGLMFEVGLDFKIAHGHAILVAGVLPLCFALALHLTRVYGGREIKPGALAWFTWLYLPGAAGALTLMLYKGVAQYAAVRQALVEERAIDLLAIDQALFLGSRAVRAAAYGTSHSAMAIGAFVLLVALWRSAGAIGAEQSRA